MNTPQRIVALGFVVFATAVCDTTQPQPSPRLKGPSALVPAGPVIQGRFRNIFIVGGERDVVYAMDITTRIEGEFVRAPNRFFPLEIPVDQVPTAAAATADGKYLLVVCGGSGSNDSHSSINVIDTDTYTRVMEADLTPVRQDKPLGVGPSAIVAGPKTAEAPNRFYIAIAGEQAIRIVDFAVDAQSHPTVTVGGTIVGTGAITRMVINSAGTELFGADSSSQFVHRVSIDGSNAVAHFDVGGPSLDVALVANATEDVLFVARPDNFSVAVFDPNTGKHRDADPIFAPRIPDSQPFEDIYLGAVPARLWVEHSELQWRCISCGGAANDALQKPSAYVLVATDDGEVMYIHPTQLQLLNHLWCSPPKVFPTTTVGNQWDADTVPTPPFVPCGTPDRKRRVCAQTSNDAVPADSGVIVFPGTTPGSSFLLSYESLLPGFNRASGGGRLADDGVHLIDATIDPALLPIPLLVGDLVTVESRPIATDGECAGFDPATPPITVAALYTDDAGKTGMVLSRPIPPRCYSTDLGYSVRIGNSFLLTGAQATGTRAPLARLRPGDTYGLNAEAVRFTIRPDLTYVRDQFWEFQVSAPYDRVVAGRGLNAAGTALVSIGRLPTDILVDKFGVNDGNELTTTALVSFGGNDTLLRILPGDTQQACVQLDSTQILR